METRTFSRKELYDLVWSLPMIALSKKYNISAVELKKTCLKYGIPLPEVGYWKKLEFGKKVKQIPLEILEEGEQQVVLTLEDNNSEERIVELSPVKTLQKEIEEQLKKTIVVPERLTNPDKLIISTRDKLNGKFKYTDIDYNQKCSETLNITVSKEQEPRALRIMDTLVKALKMRNHTFKPAHFNSNVCIKGQIIELSLREKTTRVKSIQKNSWDNVYDYKTNGVLIIKIDKSYHCKEFKDGRLPLEQQLSLIIASLEMVATREIEWEIECQKSREKRELEEKIRKENEKRRSDDLDAFKDTLNKSSRWHKAINLRNYINEVEAKAIERNDLSDELINWLEWARKKADWYDPFVEDDDVLLNGVDKETLVLGKSGNGIINLL